MKSRTREAGRFETSIREFSEAVTRGRERSSSLRGPTSDLTQDSESLRIALEEVRSQHEELAAADEELRAQLDELSTESARTQVERARYRELFDLAPDGYFVTDRAAVVEDANAAASKLLAVDPRIVQGKPLAAFVDAADARMFRGAVETARNGEAVAIEIRLRPRTSEPVWTSLRGVPIRNGTALLWIARDIHAQRTRSLEDAEGHAPPGEVTAERLDRLVRANRDKTEVIARERRLRQQLEEERNVQDRFVTGLAHSLRTPLNAVLGFTELLRRETFDHHARDRALAMIERSARSQVRLLEELLDIARLGTDQAQLERTPIALDELVQRCADTLAAAAHDSGVSLRFTGPTERLVIAGDRPRLERAMTTLLADALAASPARGHVAVTATREGHLARVTVADFGRGIAPRALPRLFDPARPTADSPSRDAPGLELYLVKQTVEMHGGTIAVESEGLGRGARFVVSLPLLGPPPAAVEEPLPPSDVPFSSRAALEGLRVIVVDDDDDSRELLSWTLRQRGAAVTSVADVGAALAAFEASPPDVVVSDIEMPGRDGCHLARALRASPTARPMLIAVSGLSSPADVERALDAGFDVHLTKPIEPAELVALVSDAARPRAC
jgi:PAS domain S-box-containing protein